MSVSKIAETEVVTASRDASVAEVAERMADDDVGCVVVVEDERPVGVITDRNIALAVAETPDVAERRVEDLMTEDPVTVTGDRSFLQAARTLDQQGVRRLPVVDDDGALRGIITLDDITVALSAEFDSVSEVIEKQSPRF